jgi:NADH-quinone oxidoreductase subunit E/NADP-reducing hydrogenase subunit HndA
MDEIVEKKNEFISFLEAKRDKGSRQSALIPALHKAQELFGYISRETMEEISRCLGIPSAYIWGVITFYHGFTLKPRGKYVISICMGTACYVKGVERILERIKEYLGIDINETTADKMWTLETKACLGCCGLAPVMMINEKVHGELTTEKVSEILKALGV